jgi:hypothetical protein
MTFLRNFAAFWYDFVIGDDWMVAAGVVVLLVATALLARAELTTAEWALLPIGAMLVLAYSTLRAARSTR